MKLKHLTQGALIAALYVILTWAAQLLGLASREIQVRFSEALTILPVFTPAAIPGLFIGCILANLLTGCALWDVIFGSLATLIGAVITYLLRRYKWTAPLPAVAANTIVVPFIIKYVYGIQYSIIFLALAVFIGEVISCCGMGYPLMALLNKYKKQIFK